MLVRSVRGSGRRSEAENRGNVRPATRREIVPDAVIFVTIVVRIPAVGNH